MLNTTHPPATSHAPPATTTTTRSFAPTGHRLSPTPHTTPSNPLVRHSSSHLHSHPHTYPPTRDVRLLAVGPQHLTLHPTIASHAQRRRRWRGVDQFAAARLSVSNTERHAQQTLRYPTQHHLTIVPHGLLAVSCTDLIQQQVSCGCLFARPLACLSSVSVLCCCHTAQLSCWLWCWVWH